MNTTSNITDEFSEVETWLAEAGFSFTAVDACPHPNCELCTTQTMRAAA